MKPQTFATLGLVATASLAAALTAYSASIPWARGPATGAPLFPNLGTDAARVAEIQVTQSDRTTTIARAGDTWVFKNRDNYPVIPDRVKTLLTGATEARLIESKTANPARYAELSLEDPSAKSATSVAMKLLDDKGTVLAEAIFGKSRADAFGANKYGTYVRKPGDPQTWLVNAALRPDTGMREWVNTKLFDTMPEKIKRVVIEVKGEEPLEIVGDGADKVRTFSLTKMPDGMKPKGANSIDDLVDALSLVEFEDVRKAAANPAAGDTVTIDTDAGLRTVLKIRKDGSETWVIASVTGEGEAAKAAEEAMKRLQGYEFRLQTGRADRFLKKRADILESKDQPKSEEPPQGGPPANLGPRLNAPPPGAGAIPGLGP